MSWWDGVTVSEPRPDGSAARVRFCSPGVQRLQTSAWMTFCFLPGIVMQARQGGGPPVALISLAPTVMTLLVNRRFGVELTQRALVTRGLATREIPWTDVRDITVRRQLGTKRVTLRLANGRTRNLREPLTGFPHDPDFDRKLHTIVLWWTQRRGW